MIDRVHVRLVGWAEQCFGGLGFFSVSPLGALIDGGVAETIRHRRRRVVERSRVAVVSGDVCGEVYVTQSRAAQETALGSQSRVSKGECVRVSLPALEVDGAVAALPDDLREAVRVFYFDGSLALDVRAKRLGVSAKTMYRRIHKAHQLLDDRLYNDGQVKTKAYQNCSQLINKIEPSTVG